MGNITKKCEWCGKEFTPTCPNNYLKQRFCSVQCKEKARNKRRNPHANEWRSESKTCLACRKTFLPKIKHQKFCSEKCKGAYKYKSGQVTTDSQYEKISGNWRRYVQRLNYCDGYKRGNDMTEIVLKKLEEQDYKCALSGVPLTCKLERGKTFWTNASVDRIVPGYMGGEYTEDNIQIVCHALNLWKSTMSNDEFIEWCKLVAEHNK